MCRNLDLWFILFYCLLSKFFFFFSPLFTFFLLSVLLSFLLLSSWFLFLSSFIFPLLFRHCFIPVSLAHVVSYLAYPNLLGTKRLGCCCCCCRLHRIILVSITSLADLSASLCLYVIFTGKILFGRKPPTIHHSFWRFTSRFFSTDLLGALI
jgi:hypothetical protein